MSSGRCGPCGSTLPTGTSATDGPGGEELRDLLVRELGEHGAPRQLPLRAGARGAKRLLVDLAAIVLRQVVDELDDARILVLRKLRSTCSFSSAASAARLVVAGAEHDERLRLDEALVLDADDRARGDRRVPEQALLDLERRDPQAADLEEIVGATAKYR